jgi:hypothetical protein
MLPPNIHREYRGASPANTREGRRADADGHRLSRKATFEPVYRAWISPRRSARAVSDQIEPR